MPDRDPRTARRRRWTNVVVIVASAWAIAASVWGTGPESLETPWQVGLEGWLGAAYALGGFAGFGAVFSAPRWPGVARGLAGLGGLLVLSGFAAMREPTTLAVLSIGGTGLALLAGAFFMGPMPTPEEEGKPR